MWNVMKRFASFLTYFSQSHCPNVLTVQWYKPVYGSWVGKHPLLFFYDLGPVAPNRSSFNFS